MEQQVMDRPVPDAGMCGCDRDIFERVWRRVMPEAGEGCPIQLTRREEELAAPQPARESGAALAVSAPAPEVPETPEIPQMGHDVPCLGQASAVYAALLREMIDGETEDWRFYQGLARRASGSGGRMLGTLAADERRHAKRLSTAYFLITGQRYQPQGQGGSRPTPDLMNGLREQFVQEQREAAAYQAAAEETADHCLKVLYLELAEDETLHARLIRNLLEQM